MTVQDDPTYTDDMTTATASIDLEEIRNEVQVSKVDWKRLILDTPNPDERALQARALRTEFNATIRENLDREFASPPYVIDGRPAIGVIEAARAMMLGDFHLTNLRWRGRIPSNKHGRRYIFYREDLEALIDERIKESWKLRRASLAQPFVHYLQRNLSPLEEVA